MFAGLPRFISFYLKWRNHFHCGDPDIVINILCSAPAPPERIAVTMLKDRHGEALLHAQVDMAEDERAGRGLPGPGGDRCPGRGSFRETRGACRALITPLFLSALSISLFSRSFSYPVSSLPGEWNDTAGNCSPAEGLRCFRALLQGGLSAPRSAGATSRNRGPCARGDPRVIRSRRSCPSPAHR